MKIATGRALAATRLALLMSGLLLGASGCYEQNTRVVVFPDGSGRIVVTRHFTPVAVRLIETQATAMRGMAGSVRTEDLFFAEKQLKADAKRLFGKGVHFVSAQRLDHNGGRGSVALYSFDKIDGVVLQPSQLLQSSMRSLEGRGGGMDEEPDVETEEAAAVEEVADAPEGDNETDPFAMHGGYSPYGEAYRFKFVAGAQPKLSVRVPRALRPKTKDEKASPGDENGDDSSEMMMGDEEEIPPEARQQMMANGNPLQLTGNETSHELALKLCKGLRFSIDVEVRGAATIMNATHPDARQAGRCTLLRLDAEEALKKSGAKGMREVQELFSGRLGRLIGKPGITTENQPELTFLIKPATPAVTPAAIPKPAAP